MSKINILIHQNSIQKPGLENMSIQNFMMAGEKYDEIFIGNGLGYLEPNIIGKFLGDCLSRLNVGGILSIQDLDITLTCNKVGAGLISLEDSVKLLFGRMSHHSIYSVLSFLESTKKCINRKKSIDGLEFILEVKKVSE